MITTRDNMSLGCAGLGVGTAGATIKTTNVLHFLVQGLAYAKAVTDNIALTMMTKVPAVPAVALAASQVAVFFVSVKASDGSIVLEQSKVAGSATAAGYQPGAFEWPAETPGFAIIGAFKVATNASGAYTLGTTLNSAANQTVTYYNAAFDYGVPIPY